MWVGKRESDILTYKYFDISITFWGSNQNNNFSFCTTKRSKDNYNKDFAKYVIKILLKYIWENKEKNIEIHFYNNSFAYKLIEMEPSLEKYIININPKQIFDIVRHKTLSRVWLQNTVAVPQFTYLSKAECDYNTLLKIFPSYDNFVIQKSISGGGNGTYLVNQRNWQDVVHNLNNYDVYLISPYYNENISLSCHLIIDDKKVIVFPISIQLLKYENNKISYCGNRYIPNNDVISEKSRKLATDIGKRLMCSGYRGICGLDLIFSNNELMLIEINPRYQGSSYLINAELKEANLPSLFELNKMAFNGCICKEFMEKIEEMEISLQTNTCFYTDSSTKPIIYPRDVCLYLDGVQDSCEYEEGVYLYRYLKKEN